MDPVTLDRPLPTKIGIIGFADSRDEAPFADPSWEMWGVNDVYAHVPRIERSFELHHLGGLDGRRNPQYAEWLSKTATPVYMWEAAPNFPSSVAFPREQVMQAFGNYFTNSISWMTALALMLLTEPDGSGRRRAREGVELGLWGVDMAHETEYGSQRPSCEYYVGIARALGVKTYIPETSDLLKCSSLYGIETTSPLRIKMARRIKSLNEQHNSLLQQEMQLQNQIQQLQATRNQLKGAMGAFKYTMGVWTMPTDNVEKTDKVRSLAPVSDGSGQPQSMDIDALLKQIDLQETQEAKGGV